MEDQGSMATVSYRCEMIHDSFRIGRSCASAADKNFHLTLIRLSLQIRGLQLH